MKLQLLPPKDELISHLKSALIAASGAGLTYLIQAAAGYDFGQFTPLVVAILSFATNYIRKSVKVGQ